MITIKVLKAGYFYSDAGASLGNLPRSIWGRFLSVDEKHRMKLNLNLLLIKLNERLILVDTGIGTKLNEKEIKIFSPSLTSLETVLAEEGYSANSVTDVIMTHLHHDHAGGITAINQAGKEYLTLANACYHIQRKEWEMAKNPDDLNRAAYDFKKNLALLETYGKVNLVDGDYSLCPEVSLKLVGGHSEGMQVVLIQSGQEKYIYAGDIIPSAAFLKLAITSAYDVCRKDTVKAKKWILDKVNNQGYKLVYDHSTEEVFYDKK
jgi:glyoxylase-like metal-dependent hydrolase (beta-lactamase superfamily II)